MTSLPTPYFEDESVQIYHGDCRELLPLIPKVDLVLTDPPYNEVNRKTQGLRSIDKGGADSGSFDIDEIAAGLLNTEAHTFYIWAGTEQVSRWRELLVDAKCSTRICVWEKSNPSPMNGQYLWLSSLELCVYGKRNGGTFNGFCDSPIWRYPVQSGIDHPTVKPVDLFKKCVLSSSNAGDTILDPFMGSGTTLRAAKDLGRKAIGIEIEERYCEIAAKRMSQGVLL